MKKPFLFLLFLGLIIQAHADRLINTQIVIVGGGASGTMAGIQAARMGAKVVLTEELPWLGGMLTSAGVSAIDGNHNLPSGLWGEFREELYKWYGGEKGVNTGWVSHTLFEPSVGAKILQNMTARERNLTVLTRNRYDEVYQTSKGWVVALYDPAGNRTIVKAKILIDATELGDVAARLGVRYDVGMDAKNTYNERVAPQEANGIVQDLTYVLTLQDYGTGTDKTIAQPASYKKEDFICSCEKFCPDKKMPRLFACDKMLTYGQLPNGKYMINWPVNGNDFYVNLVEMTEDQRFSALKKAKEFSLGFLYYIQTELGYRNLGLADEYPTTDHLPMIPYHRESRRIEGLAKLTMNHMERPFEQVQALYRTGIAVGDYPIDQHHGKNTAAPDLYYVPVPSYNVPLGALIPKNVRNLIVAEKSISVSNLANGATRLQPVVLQIGQAAGALAAVAAKGGFPIDYTPIRQVQESLLKSKAYLMPFIDVKLEEKRFLPIQKIGATGILRGVGKNVGWSNQTLFYPDSTLSTQELWQGIKDFDTDFNYILSNPTQKLTVEETLAMIITLDRVADSRLIAFKHFDNLKGFVKERWTGEYGLQNFDLARSITRAEVAILFDHLLDPFWLKSVTWDGTLK